MTATGDSKATALAIGFEDRDYFGYGVEVFTYFILEDPFFIAEYEKNWQREISECPQHISHPDFVLQATLASFSETEKGALRRRVQFAMTKWDRS